MADLLSAMVARSKDIAQPLAQAFTAGNRPYLVRIERPGDKPIFNRDTGQMTNPVDVIVYLGPARIFPVTGPLELEVGDERTTFSSARISINAFDGAPRIDDIVTVLENQQSLDGSLDGRQFTVLDVEVGGHFNIGWELTTQGVAPSRRT